MKISKHLKDAIKIAKTSGLFLKNNLGKIKKISYKGEINPVTNKICNRVNLVTDIDRKSEALIVKFLKSRYPDYGILTEETPFKEENCEYKWIIDPLDGTTNYAHAFAFFCVSVALERSRQGRESEIIAGAVYEPMRNELFFAERNKGAYLNGRRITVSKTGKLKRALLATGFAYSLRRYNINLRHFKNFLMRTQAVRRAGSAALDLCYVACGRFDGFWELDLKPWDTAAGKLIVEEGGGRISSFKGAKYSIYSKQILANNGKIHKAMRAVLAISR
ncbi:MAG: inositol monophosphatase family protein [Candidatus Omnitrophota bacterium]